MSDDIGGVVGHVRIRIRHLRLVAGALRPPYQCFGKIARLPVVKHLEPVPIHLLSPGLQRALKQSVKQASRQCEVVKWGSGIEAKDANEQGLSYLAPP